MALPLGTTGSLSPTFVSARDVSLAVNHPSAFALLQMVSNHPEGNFGRLRYFLGGDRPSQTAHLTVFQDLIQGLWLGSQYYKGGIPRMTPHRLASMLHSLPPILYM